MKLISTLSLSEAAGRPWDVAVVGGGPAGAMVARQLARWQNSVLLIDKASFPRAKVCGSCLNPRAISVLEYVGLGDLVVRHGGIPLKHVRLGAQGRLAHVPLPGGFALSRPTLDTALVRAAIDAGASFLSDTRASLGALTGQRRELNLRQAGHPSTIRARLVLAADGLAGGLLGGQDRPPSQVTVGSRLGAGAAVDRLLDSYDEGTISMACSTEGYVGVVRVEGKRCTIAAALDPAAVKENGTLGATAAQVLEKAGMPRIPDLGSLFWQGTPRLTRRASRLSLERTLVLGDAAGYIEPITGEGIAWALDSAIALAPLAHRAVRHWQPAVGTQWARTYRKIVVRRQVLCYCVARVLRHPSLCGMLVSVLSQSPSLAAPLIRRMHTA